MKKNTYKQMATLMAPYLKKGIAYRQKQFRRLLAIYEDIFAHEPYLNDEISRVGRRQIIGYWERTKEESSAVRKEKYQVLCLFYSKANLLGKVPKPK
ncbi:hypothetical protein AB4549_10310 [Vibrio breoganii]|uniref:hypothetical protein n=1 Tax=Vibrio breoganii TaxID=553239 RepID=UPI0003743AC1|nr:hypothetical protein [Vibrio breoganii]OEF86369.1 hypothetical protein B003_05010 [Vibrio breoganii 1C10]